MKKCFVDNFILLVRLYDTPGKGFEDRRIFGTPHLTPYFASMWGVWFLVAGGVMWKIKHMVIDVLIRGTKLVPITKLMSGDLYDVLLLCFYRSNAVYHGYFSVG